MPSMSKTQRRVVPFVTWRDGAGNEIKHEIFPATLARVPGAPRAQNLPADYQYVRKNDHVLYGPTGAASETLDPWTYCDVDGESFEMHLPGIQENTPVVIRKSDAGGEIAHDRGGVLVVTPWRPDPAGSGNYFRILNNIAEVTDTPS